MWVLGLSHGTWLQRGASAPARVAVGIQVIQEHSSHFDHPSQWVGRQSMGWVHSDYMYCVTVGSVPNLVYCSFSAILRTGEGPLILRSC